MKTIYTIGYAMYRTPEEMIKDLRMFNVTCLVDVRSMPYSAIRPEFNYAKEFGARQEGDKFQNAEHAVDFDKFARTEEFLSGIQKLIRGTELGYVFVLMCAEKDPMECHRSILIGRHLKEIGFTVEHIRENARLENQEEMEIRAIGNQVSMFDDGNPIARFYREQGARIAYRGKPDSQPD